MVKLLKAEFDITALQHKGQVDYKAYNEREPGQRHSNKNIQKRPNEEQYLSETER